MTTSIQSFVLNSLTPISNKGNFSSGFLSSSEASASELLRNLEDKFPWYYMDSSVLF